MAVNIFERYGIKEVANVYFEALADDKLSSDIKEGDIVLYLDTLKVSTVETTAENVSAQGGWGNPKLVTWDYGKDINVTLEDAVISWEEMRILMGAKMKKAGAATGVEGEVEEVIVRKNAETETAKGATSVKLPADMPENATYKWINLTTGERGQVGTDLPEGVASKQPSVDANEAVTRIRFFWQETKKGGENGEATELVITPNDFPGTYRVVGDALIRSEKTGMDEAFQFVINKAKLLSEVTLTMQAEGDPSTFNMTLNVLRDPSGNMMSLIKY